MRPDKKVARYKMIKGPHHTHAKVNPGRWTCWILLQDCCSHCAMFRFKLLAKAASRMKTDGLNSASYKVVSQQQYSLYTKITVELKDDVNC